MIPDGWTEVELGEICDFLHGYGFRPPDWSTEGLPIIRIQNLNGSRDFNYFNGEPKEDWIIKPGTLLFAWAGTKGASFGPALWNGPIGVLNQHIYRVQPKTELDQIWLYSILQMVTREIETTAHGFKSTLVHVYKADITGQRVPLPPLPEQRKIAAILSTWDEAITLTEQLITTLKQRKQALMQLLLTGAVRFGEFEDCEWIQVTLDNIATINKDSLTEATNPESEFYYIDLSMVAQGNIDFPIAKKRFSDLPSRARRILHFGDIIMATVRPNLLGFAKCDFDPLDVICSTGFALMTPHLLDDMEFIYQSLYSDSILRQIQDLVTGSNYPAINSTQVKQLRLDYSSSPTERVKIGSVLATSDNEITLHEKMRTILNQQKRALMQQLLTGEVRVTPDD